ncbi:MAG: hypothetical protein M1444_04255 [Patescibacteria group bacterium]|nr:hypothetical protein [Patescibacteria group bacterium]
MARSLTEQIGFKGEKGQPLAGVSFPVPEPCPRGIRQMIGRQMFIGGRDVVLYLADEGVLRRISSYDFEEAGQLTRRQRRKFLDGVMEEAQFADRFAIEASRD